MTLLKPIPIILLIISALLIIFVSFIYFVLRTTTNDISDKFPYSEIINQELVTLQPCFIALNYQYSVVENPYILDMNNIPISDDINKIYQLPVGTVLNIDKTMEVKGGVSGFASNLVLGTVFIKELNKNVKFEFHWGTNPTYGLYKHDENYDIYELAPWQKTQLPYKYFWNGRKELYDWEAYK